MPIGPGMCEVLIVIVFIAIVAQAFRGDFDPRFPGAAAVVWWEEDSDIE